MSTQATTTSTGGSFLGSLSDRFFNYLDYTIDDAFNMLPSQQNSTGADMWGGNWAEQTPPNTQNPTDAGWNWPQVGNNPQTWGLALLAIGGAYLVYRAVK